MPKLIPKVLIVTGTVIAITMALNLPTDVAILISILGIAFVTDALLWQTEKHRAAMEWFINSVHLTDKPLGESDAPESVKKLVRKEEDNKTPKL